MRNLKITLAYDGTEFHGWQMQPGWSTVQGVLSGVLSKVAGEPVVAQGSGRTDAGVHALGQVASCAVGSPIPVGNLMKAMNDVLPAAIRVLEVAEAGQEFHARKSAQAKTYQYRIYRGAICPPFLARYVYHHPYKLEEKAMAEAAAVVVGERDFTSFAAVDPERGQEDEPASNRRTLFSSSWERRGEELVYTVRGSGFLHHMVRNLVGTFLLVGKGVLQPAEVERILEAKARSANPGATAPASGLYLVSVEY